MQQRGERDTQQRTETPTRCNDILETDIDRGRETAIYADTRRYRHGKQTAGRTAHKACERGARHRRRLYRCTVSPWRLLLLTDARRFQLFRSALSCRSSIAGPRLRRSTDFRASRRKYWPRSYSQTNLRWASEGEEHHAKNDDEINESHKSQLNCKYELYLLITQ